MSHPDVEDLSRRTTALARGSRIADALTLVPVPIIVSEAASHRIVAVNDAAATAFRVPPDRLVGSRVDDLTHPDNRHELAANFRRCTEGGGFATLKRYLRGDGTSFIGHLQVAPTPGHDELVTAVITSVEETDQLRAEVLAAARIDELTGALRRGAFLETARLETTMRPNYGLLFIDIDNMKETNDRLGHGAGDALLCAVSDRIAAAFRHGDLLGRFGGDEFVVFVHNVPSAGQIVRLARALERRVGKPLRHAGEQIEVSVSIGVAFCANAVLLDEAIAAADVAMLASKNRHRAGDYRVIEETDVVVLPSPSEAC